MTQIIAPPSHLALCLQMPTINTIDLSSIRKIVCAGAPVSSYVLDEFVKYMPNGKILIGYGMSEVSGVVTMNYCNDKKGSVGMLAEGVQIKIINDDGLSLGPNINGEICMKTQYTFLVRCG